MGKYERMLWTIDATQAIVMAQHSTPCARSAIKSFRELQNPPAQDDRLASSAAVFTPSGEKRGSFLAIIPIGWKTGIHRSHTGLKSGCHRLPVATSNRNYGRGVIETLARNRIKPRVRSARATAGFGQKVTVPQRRMVRSHREERTLHGTSRAGTTTDCTPPTSRKPRQEAP